MVMAATMLKPEKGLLALWDEKIMAEGRQEQQ